MAFKNSLKISLEKRFFSFAGRRLASSPPAEAGPARQQISPPRRSSPPCLGPAQCAGSFSRAPRPSLRHAATASGSSRRVATTCRRRPPRGSRGLTPRPRARLHLLVPTRSLTLARVSSSPLQSREPPALPSPRPQLRRRFPPPPAPHSPIPSASNSASLSDTWCSRLCRRLSQGSACSKLRRRRPWRHLARPPWNVPFLPFSAMLSCLLAFAIASRTSCARSLALARPIMAAGRAAPSRPRARTGESSAFASQPGRPGKAAVGRSPAARPPRSSSRVGRAGRLRPWAS